MFFTRFSHMGGNIMSKSPSTPKLEDRILEVLKAGEMQLSEIKAAIPDQVTSVGNCLTRLKTQGKVIRIRQGLYRLPKPSDARAGVKISREEPENIETINKLLTLYDTLLDTVAVSIEEEDWKEIVEKIETIKSLRWLGATVDQLMKRWYLVHRGYDANTKQAHEDAKQKTAAREKTEMENAPPEDQIVVVREYDETMRDVLAKLPGKNLKKHKG